MSLPRPSRRLVSGVLKVVVVGVAAEPLLADVVADVVAAGVEVIVDVVAAVRAVLALVSTSIIKIQNSQQ